MTPSKLLRFLLAGWFTFGVVESGSEGSTAVEVEDDDVEGAAKEGGETAEEHETVITIGDETPPEEDEAARAPEWVRDLRKSNREKDRRIRELEAKVSQAAPAPQATVVGEKPTLESCDFDGDKFTTALESWHERKRAAESEQTAAARAQDEAKAAWQTKLDAYGKFKTELKVRDFEDAEAQAAEVLNITQQGIVVNGADNPAVVIYALGKNPKKAKELAAITDPVKFAFAVAKLETQLKVTQRKAAPVPERLVRSSVPGAAVVDNQLDRLRSEAEKTGDYTKVHQYKQQLRKRAA